MLVVSLNGRFRGLSGRQQTVNPRRVERTKHQASDGQEREQDTEDNPNIDLAYAATREEAMAAFARSWRRE